MKTTMGILAGKASHFVLSKLGRGSTLPGKIALKFDKDILDLAFLAVRKVEVIPVIMLAPLGLVTISPKASLRIPTVKAVVRVLPLVPVTTTIS